MPDPLITITTDFGESDAYVASLKGAILSVNPSVTIVDITHSVGPQRIEQGAFLLGLAWPHFPANTIHLVVVDPSVGTERPAVAIATPTGTFVGPDNGVLSAALPDEAREAVIGQTGPVPLPTGTVCHLLANRAFHRKVVSNTFHGRDIFAPVAAHLSRGIPLEELGPTVPEVTALPPFRARPQPDGSLLGLIRHVDHFGNMVSDVRAEQLPPPPLLLEIGGRQIRGLSDTYGRSKSLLALIGSSGLLEIAVGQGSAAADLNAGIGQPITVRPA